MVSGRSPFLLGYCQLSGSLPCPWDSSTSSWVKGARLPCLAQLAVPNSDPSPTDQFFLCLLTPHRSPSQFSSLSRPFLVTKVPTPVLQQNHPIPLLLLFSQCATKSIGLAASQEWGTGVSQGQESESTHSCAPACLQQRCLHSVLQLRSYGEKLDKDQAALEQIESKADPR